MTVLLHAWPANRADTAYKNRSLRLNIEDLYKYVDILLTHQADSSLILRLLFCIKFFNTIIYIIC